MGLHRTITITYTVGGEPLPTVDYATCNRINLRIAMQSGYWHGCRFSDRFYMGDCDFYEIERVLADVSADFPGIVIEADVEGIGDDCFIVTAHDGKSQRRDEVVYYEPIDDTLAKTGSEWRDSLNQLLKSA